jgi:hypothetical protein
VTCGLFFQVDRFGPTDTSEDKFMPITFAAGVAATSLPLDVLTVTANGTPLVRNVASELTYRSAVAIGATAASGLPTEVLSLTPDCVVRDGFITALKGSGDCALNVKTAGDEKVAPTSSIYPFRLGLGDQSISLDRFDVLSMTGSTNTAIDDVAYQKGNTLVIQSTNGSDKVTLTGGDWSDTNVNVSVGGQGSFSVYQHSGNNIHVVIDDNILRAMTS